MTSANIENKQKLNDVTTKVGLQSNTLQPQEGLNLDKELEIAKFIQFYVSSQPIITLFDLKNVVSHFMAKNNWKFDLEEFLKNREVHKVFDFPPFFQPKITPITCISILPKLYLYLNRNKDKPFVEKTFLAELVIEMKFYVQHSLHELGVKIRIGDIVEKKTEEKNQAANPKKSVSFLNGSSQLSSPSSTTTTQNDKNGSPLSSCSSQLSSSSSTTTTQSEKESNGAKLQCESFSITDCLRIFIDLLVYYYPSIPFSFSMLKQRILSDLKSVETLKNLQPYFVFLTLFYAKNIDDFDVIKFDIARIKFARYLKQNQIERDSFLEFVQLAFIENENVSLPKNLKETDELANLITKILKHEQHSPPFQLQMIINIIEYLDNGYRKIEILDLVLSDIKLRYNKEQSEKPTKNKKRQKKKIKSIRSPPVTSPTLQENDTTLSLQTDPNTHQKFTPFELKYKDPINDTPKTTKDTTKTPFNNIKKIKNNSKNNDDDFDMNVEIEDHYYFNPSSNHHNNTTNNNSHDIDISALIDNF